MLTSNARHSSMDPFGLFFGSYQQYRKIWIDYSINIAILGPKRSFLLRWCISKHEGYIKWPRKVPHMKMKDLIKSNNCLKHGQIIMEQLIRKMTSRLRQYSTMLRLTLYWILHPAPWLIWTGIARIISKTRVVPSTKYELLPTLDLLVNL